MASKFVSVEYRDAVGVMTLDRPPDNLLNIAMLEEINDVLLSFKDRPTTKVLVIRSSSPKFFSRGIDFTDHTADKVTRLLHVFHRIFETLRLIDVVSVAAVHARASGGGFQLALGCNLIVATESASFALPEIKFGLFAPTACVFLPRIAPRRKAMEWNLLGEDILAAELERFGVVNRVWPEEEFESSLEAFLSRLTKHSGPVLHLTKQAQAEAYYTTYEEALYKVENLYLRELMALDSAQEGVQAYLEGREPNWTDG